MTKAPNASPGDATPSPERWAQVRALVEDALALTGSSRSAFLTESCGTDARLRERVERLVAACERADDNWEFLSHPAGELAAPLVAAALPGMAELLARVSTALADRYRIEREIGAGGMATVYRAHDLRHGRQVAIKVLHPELSVVLGAERFLREIKTTAALQHPHILPLFDSGTADGLLFYVMPLVEGKTLRARLAIEKQLPVIDVVRIVGEVASALDYAHRRGVIHRDIKPENILLHEGRPVVADFGIALAVQTAGAQRVTRPGLSLGTPQYMSPEQTTGEQEITARSDIYALGAVTYEMLTGEPPFTGATVQQIVARVRADQPRGITVQRKSVASHIEAAVLTALEKLPADRFESAGEFARALGDGEFRGLASARSVGTAGRRQRTFVASLVGIALALAVAAAWVWLRAPNESSGVERFTVLLPRGLSIAPKSDVGASIAVSPDGKSVVFVGIAGDGTRRLYARALDAMMPAALAGTDEGSQPFYSPDGRWIGFVSEGGLQKVPAEGGLPQALTAMPGIVEATWTSHDVIVFAALGGLYAIPAAGGTPTLVSAWDSTKREGVDGPIALADGDHVLFASRGRIELASLSARSRKSLGIRGMRPLGVIDGQLIYASRDNRLMAVPFDASAGRATGPAVAVATDVTVTSFGAVKAALSRSGTLAYLSGERDSWIVLTNGQGAAQVMLPDRHAYSFPRFSPDGKRIAVGIDADTRSDIWVCDLASRTRVRLSSGGSVNERPEWTPDGRRVLYRSDANRVSSLWWRPADLSAPAVPLVSGEPGFWEGVITPDSREIVVQADVTIAVRALVGDTTLRNIVASGQIETEPRVSPDGRWLALVIQGSGPDQVVVQPFPGPGSRVQVSSSGGSEPVWSPVGRRLFYRANKKFMAATFTTAPTFAVATRDTLFEDTFVPAPAPHANYDVSPDGKRLLVLQSVEDAQLVIVHNWGAEVRARLNRRVPQD